jgi:hypothetical protein
MTFRGQVTKAVSVAGIVVALTVVGAAVRNSMGTSDFLARPSSEAASRADYERFSCLQRDLHAVVPRNATVYAGKGDTAGSQLLSEIAAGWAQESRSSDGAKWVLALHSGSGGCDGQEIDAAARS